MNKTYGTTTSATRNMRKTGSFVETKSATIYLTNGKKSKFSLAQTLQSPISSRKSIKSTFSTTQRGEQL